VRTYNRASFLLTTPPFSPQHPPPILPFIQAKLRRSIEQVQLSETTANYQSQSKDHIKLSETSKLHFLLLWCRTRVAQMDSSLHSTLTPHTRAWSATTQHSLTKIASSLTPPTEESFMKVLSSRLLASGFPLVVPIVAREVVAITVTFVADRPSMGEVWRPIRGHISDKIATTKDLAGLR
jgi:hypothetical protein